jgi:hypothetical protein
LLIVAVRDSVKLSAKENVVKIKLNRDGRSFHGMASAVFVFKNKRATTGKVKD